jgi:hypothetical protein
MNTELEELYFARDNRADVDGIGDAIKVQLRDEGGDLVTRLLADGNTVTALECLWCARQ